MGRGLVINAALHVIRAGGLRSLYSLGIVKHWHPRLSKNWHPRLGKILKVPSPNSLSAVITFKKAQLPPVPMSIWSTAPIFPVYERMRIWLPPTADLTTGADDVASGARSSFRGHMRSPLYTWTTYVSHSN